MNNFNNNCNLLLNNNSHPIIQQKNTFSLNRKLLTIHAIDREKHFYINSNSFSIKTPQPYINVESLRLTEINFPSKIYNFSKNLDNNTLMINDVEIIIDDGHYTPENLSNFLQKKTNNSIKVKYLENIQRFIFLSKESFTLIYNSHKNLSDKNLSDKNLCDKNIRSNNSINSFKKIPEIFINEGFFYDIGFDITLNFYSNKKNIFSNKYHKYHNYHELTDLSGYDHYIITDSPPRFKNLQPIYMEIDSININYDELDPFPSGTNNMLSNFNNSSTKSAFIKIPPCVFNNPDFSDFNFFQNTVAFFEAPLKRIQNFKFKFRYHDNKLVDLDNQDVNFTLEINQLRSNMHRDMKIQTPIL